MKKRFYSLSLALLMILIMPGLCFSRNYTISEILKNPGKYVNEEVVLMGNLISFTQINSTTGFFICKDDFSNHIKVISADANNDAIQLYNRYRITGIVSIQNKEVILTAYKGKIELIGPVFSTSAKNLKFGEVKKGESEALTFTISNIGNEPLIINDISSSNNSFSVDPVNFLVKPNATQLVKVKFTAENKGQVYGNITIEHNGVGSPVTIQLDATVKSVDYILFALIGGIVLIGLVIVVLLLMRKKSPATIKTRVPLAEPFVAAPPRPSAPIAQPNIPVSGASFKTIVVSPSAPKTIKFIAGFLEILNGEDKGKNFRIAGYPTPTGGIVTIGREEVTGERAFAHIQLREKTVSRKQAELISTDGKLYIKNLSETNFTKVDGVELKPEERIELKPDSVIKMGELEFRYKL
jgi:hypothetical protein